MIDDALYTILSGSAFSPVEPPAPGVQDWFANAAAETTVAPYGVYNRFGDIPITTHDRQLVTRQWRYRFTIFHPQYLTAAQQCKTLSDFLIAYTDAPNAGIMRFLKLGGNSSYLQKQRYHGLYVDFDIMENIP